MPSSVAQIAAQIAVDLAFANVGGPLSYDVSTTRLPTIAAETLATRKLFVPPAARTSAFVARGIVEHVFTVACGLFGPLTSEATFEADADALELLAETLSDWYFTHHTGNGTAYRFLLLNDFVVADRATLREKRVFAASWSYQFALLL